MGNWRTIWALYGVFSVYFLLDGYHTSLLLRTGLLTEANPLLAAAMTATNRGVCTLYAIKLFWVAFLGVNLAIKHWTEVHT